MGSCHAARAVAARLKSMFASVLWPVRARSVITSVFGGLDHVPWLSRDMTVDDQDCVCIREQIPFYNVGEALRHLYVLVKRTMSTFPPWRIGIGLSAAGVAKDKRD